MNQKKATKQEENVNEQEKIVVPLDPVRSTADPAAGQWFPDMALELVHNANPSLP